jgi:two-component system, OmpR family, phosphate regulon sensor histidine kinase PhoR
MRRGDMAAQSLQQAPRERIAGGSGPGRVARNILYILVACPIGFGYTLLLSLGLFVDLLLLLARAVAATMLFLAYWLVRATVRLLRWSARHTWSIITGLLIHTIRALIRLPVTLVRAVWGVFFSIFRPHTAWRHATTRRRERPHGRSFRPHIPTVRTLVVRLRSWTMRFFFSSDYRLGWLRRMIVRHAWIVASMLWWYLAVFERWMTGRWLQIELPELVVPQREAGRWTGRSRLLPVNSLAYFVAKVPLGIAAYVVIALALVWCGWFLGTGVEFWQGAWRRGGNVFRLPLAAGSFGCSIGVLCLGIYVLNTLTNVSGRYARRAFSPSATARRLLEAEALVIQAREKVEQAEKSRQDLIVNVSHELRTPTASIRGHIESLLIALDEPDTSATSPAMLRQYLGIVHREAERLGTLVDELLAIARAEADELQLTLMPVDAAEVIAEVHASIALLARRERQVTLVHEVQPGLPPLLADRQRLVQVLLNLVRNAITYTPAGGLVSIMLQRADAHHLVIAVADTGSGIAASDLDRIFERFYRTDASRARASGGFGLGLSIVRDLVEAMGGMVQVESTLGEGSRFEVTLPIARPEDHGTLTPSGGAEPRGHHSSR